MHVYIPKGLFSLLRLRDLCKHLPLTLMGIAYVKLLGTEMSCLDWGFWEKPLRITGERDCKSTVSGWGNSSILETNLTCRMKAKSAVAFTQRHREEVNNNNNSKLIRSFYIIAESHPVRFHHQHQEGGIYLTEFHVPRCEFFFFLPWARICF